MKNVFQRWLTGGCGMGLLFFLAGCAAKTSPADDMALGFGFGHYNDEKLSKKAGDSWNYASRRIAGRETVAIAQGVALHADHVALYEYGPAIYTGRVFLDGSGQRERHPAWPLYAYADTALWKPEYGTLALRGHLIILERESAALVVKDPSGQVQEVDMNGKRIRLRNTFVSRAYSPLEVLLPQ